MTSKEKYERTMKAILDNELEKAMTGNVFYVEDAKTRKIKCCKVEDLPFGVSTIGEVIKDLENQFKLLLWSHNSLIEIVNDNQDITTKAIDDLRKDMEEGKLF